jgi:SAM-dependent methyltransferase
MHTGVGAREPAVSASESTTGHDYIAEYYDTVADYRERPDVQFFVDAAKHSEGPVLELGCGTGRVLIPTARAGIEITGLDASERMLGVCRKRLLDEPPEVRSRVELVHGDMRDFDLPRSFRLVTTPFRPFQHLVTVADQMSCLESIRRHLTGDGRLILDVFNPSLELLTSNDLGEEFGDDEPFTMPSGERVVQRARVVSRDPLNQVNQIELIYYVTHGNGREERLVQAFPMRYLFRFELEHLLVRSGFTLEHVYADYEGTPYGSKYPGELVAVARKSDG